MTITAAPPLEPGFADPEPPAQPHTPAPALLPVHEAPYWLLAGADEESAGTEPHICRGID